MATLRQIEANRRNAELSTGPRSVEGKAVSRLNALKSGIDAQLHVIKDEDPAALEALTAEYYDRWRPSTPEVRALVDSLISNEWLLRRLRPAEAEYWDYRLIELRSDFTKNHHMLGKLIHCAGENMTRLQRRIDSVERNYHRALKELQRIQTDSPQIGFVPSDPAEATASHPPSPEAPPDTPPNPQPATPTSPQPAALSPAPARPTPNSLPGLPVAPPPRAG